MPLVLNLKPGSDVFVGDVPVTLNRIINRDEAVLSVAGRFITINSHRWMDLIPGCSALVSRHPTGPTHIRVMFEAPNATVLRGAAYRNPKKGITQ